MRLFVYGHRPDASTAPGGTDGPPPRRSAADPTSNRPDVTDARPDATGGR